MYCVLLSVVALIFFRFALKSERKKRKDEWKKKLGIPLGIIAKFRLFDLLGITVSGS